MRLLTVASSAGARAGLQLAPTSPVFDVGVAAALDLPASVAGPRFRDSRAVLEGGDGLVERLAATIERQGDRLQELGAAQELDDLRLLPPVIEPQKLICIGLNYHDHAQEAGADLPKEPMFFGKFANSLIGPGQAIRPPAHTAMVDYEAELAIVIGRRCRAVGPAEALAAVAGVAPFNDVSARDLQLANPLWTGGKAIDTFAPMGPALVLMDEVDDVQALDLTARVNGEVVQSSSTAGMIFSVAEIVSFLSRIMTLVPGDVIASGTPAGIGAFRQPPRFLTAGDEVEIEVAGIGVLTNPVEQVVATVA